MLPPLLLSLLKLPFTIIIILFPLLPHLLISRLGMKRKNMRLLLKPVSPQTPPHLLPRVMQDNGNKQPLPSLFFYHCHHCSRHHHQ
jgi:hypothetical protein